MIVSLISILTALSTASAFVLNSREDSFRSSALSLSKRQTQVCGAQGYDTTVKAYYYAQSSQYATISVCSAHCSADSKCLSFAVGNGACYGYSVAVYVFSPNNSILRIDKHERSSLLVARSTSTKQL
jgi:hypothetical protein